jgi:phosphoribosylformylglycinamidine synthase I
VKFGVVVFPGSNCDDDALQAVRRGVGGSSKNAAEFIWHGSEDLGGASVVILPGGFAHGDYLRTGALARFSPVMKSVTRFAAGGGIVLGICNGFQILLEAGMLPGAMLKNRGSHFLCKPVALRVENNRLPFTQAYAPGQQLTFPIAHGEGNYFCDPATLRELREQDRIVFRYLENPNGSLDDIAGIVNREGNVLGLMPHPERASDPLLGSCDGLGVFQSLARSSVPLVSEEGRFATLTA